MLQGYVGEVRIFAGEYPPMGWMFCEGQLLDISENDALFAIIGTTYGGDGYNNFALPDLRGRIPLHKDDNTYPLGSQGGVESVALTIDQMPAHTHAMHCSEWSSTLKTPSNMYYGTGIGVMPYADGNDAVMNVNLIGIVGNNEPHNNLQPYQCVNFIISLYGTFPSPT